MNTMTSLSKEYILKVYKNARKLAYTVGIFLFIFFCSVLTNIGCLIISGVAGFDLQVFIACFLSAFIISCLSLLIYVCLFEICYRKSKQRVLGSLD